MTTAWEAGRGVNGFTTHLKGYLYHLLSRIVKQMNRMGSAQRQMASLSTSPPMCCQAAGGWGVLLKRTLGTTLLSVVFLIASIAGLAAFWSTWPRTSNTSPLAALFALLWSFTYGTTAVLTWRRSRFTGLAFVAAIGLLLFPARFLFPGGQLFLPAFVGITLLAFLGYRYLAGYMKPSSDKPLQPTSGG